jgi:uncharacterized protein
MTRTLTITTPDGESLEADVAGPDTATLGIVIAHPHPLRGGNRFSPVVTALFTHFAAAGWAALRFDFRGVGASTGTHGDGVTERLDVQAAIGTLQREFPTAAVICAGYSFGSRVALTIDDPSLLGWVAVAPPLAVAGPSAERDVVGADPRPKLLIVAGQDNFSPPAATEPIVANWSNTTTVVIDGSDHFFNQDPSLVARTVEHAWSFAQEVARSR